MKILLVNKFLYPVGGAETYMIELGTELSALGHDVQYFGLENGNNTVGNRFHIYAEDYRRKKFQNPFALIYSRKIKKQMTELLGQFQPDVVHFNNISYDLTSSVIDACKDENIPCVMTMHDPQLVCPNHRLYIESKAKICEECLHKGFGACIKNRCIKGSLLKSVIGYLEAQKNRKKGCYDFLSAYICPSLFMQEKLSQGGYDRNKMVVFRNFSDCKRNQTVCKKGKYALYFGRLGEEKGIRLLLNSLPEEGELLIAGRGPLEEEVRQNPKVRYVGFQSGEALKKLIEEARFTVYPSIWYENSPFSVIESMSYGTPVLGTNLAGIAELVADNETGLLFENKNSRDLKAKMQLLFSDDDLIERLSKNCLQKKLVPTLREYAEKMTEIYLDVIEKKRENYEKTAE